MGIDSKRVIQLTFSITAALAGIAGCLAGLSYGVVSPYMAVSYAIKGFWWR